MSIVDEDYVGRINQIHQQLGIRPNYAHERELHLQEEATSLVEADHSADGRIHQLTPLAAKAWHEMKKAAARDGIHLLMVSGYRGVEYQQNLVQKKLDRGEDIETILRILAPPGYSEHHTGRAIDITSPDCPPCEERFEKTDAFAWLNLHAAGFDFALSYPRGNRQGFMYEPWHWALQRNEGFGL